MTAGRTQLALPFGPASVTVALRRVVGDSRLNQEHGKPNFHLDMSTEFTSSQQRQSVERRPFGESTLRQQGSFERVLVTVFAFRALCLVELSMEQAMEIDGLWL